jgi:hypothetical protein
MSLASMQIQPIRLDLASLLKDWTQPRQPEVTIRQANQPIGLLKVHLAPKWALVLMTCIIKKLIWFSSYEQVKIQWNELYAWKDANLLDRRWWSSKEDLYLFSILNLSIENTVLLREMWMDRLKISKCLIEMLTTQERYKITHLCT